MAYKLRVSQQTEDIFCKIEKSEKLSWPTLMRLAFALSIRQGALTELELYTDNLGRELNRQTITGDSDTLYKCLVQMQEGHHIPDEEYFPIYVKAHLDRGAHLLEQEKKYSRNFLAHLVELEQGI